MKWKLWTGVGLLFLGILFYMSKIDKSISYGKLKGKQTVDSVKAQLEVDVSERLMSNLRNVGLDSFPDNLLIVGLKKEMNLEVYSMIEGEYRLIVTYPFTATSGQLGPKLKQGDLQIPEGIYGIEYLNPNSSYYLSMKVTYPNDFDRSMAKKDKRTRLGGDIFIHGKSATIGCIPIGDIAIEELFTMVSYAGKGNVKVIISPQDFRKDHRYPKIKSVTWAPELYDLINKELQDISKQVVL